MSYYNLPAGLVSEEALMMVARAREAQDNDSLRARIETHKWFLSEQLGRDVGLRVAKADYLANIQPEEDWWRRGIRASLKKLGLLSLTFDGPNSLLNFERSMRGTRSLAR